MQSKKPKEKKEDNESLNAEESLTSPGQERSYVAAILEDNTLIESIIGDDLSMLSVPEYRQIVGYILQLYAEGWHNVDRFTIINLADRHPRVADVLIKMGGIEALNRICSFQMSVANFEKNRQQLKELYAKRVLISGIEKQISELKNNSEALSSDQLLKSFEDGLSDIGTKVFVVSDYTIVDPDPDEFFAKAEKAYSEGLHFKGVTTNMIGYDEMLGGMGNGRLHVFGAPTGCGKSLLSVNWSLSMAYGTLPTDRQYKVCVIDTGELIYQDDWFPRILASHSGVRVKSIQKNWFINNAGEKEAIRQSMMKFKTNPIIWKQMPDFDGPAVRSFIKRIKKREGAEIIMFDNIKINPNWTKGEDPYLKLGNLAQYMKDAAIDCEIPVVAFIQLTSDGTLTGRKKIGMTEPHVSMFAGGQRILHNTDVGGVLDFEDYEDPANDNRKLIIQKTRNDRSHRPGEYMRCIGDLKRSKLVIVENLLKTPLDNDSSGFDPISVKILDDTFANLNSQDDDLPFERWGDEDISSAENVSKDTRKNSKLDRF